MSASWKRLSEKSAPEATPFVVSQPQDHDLAQQVAELVGRRRGVALDLRHGVGALEAGVADEEVDGVGDGDLASMETDVEDDPAGPPDGVGVEHETKGRRIVEALLAHDLLAVHAPALGELGRVGDGPDEAGMGDRRGQLQMVAGERLVDAGVADRGAVVLAHRGRVAVDGRRHDVDAGRVAVEARRIEVGREGHHVAQVLGRGDDLEALAVGDRHQVVLDEVVAGAEHRHAIFLEGLLEGRGVVGLDPGQHLGFGCVGIDLGRDRDPGRLLLGQLRLADLQDGVRRQAVEGAQRDQLVIGRSEPRAKASPSGSMVDDSHAS